MGGITNMFKKPEAPPVTIVQQTPAPVAAPTPTAPLPTANTEEVQQTRALNAQEALRRGGRRSTILTTPATRMGGGGAGGTGGDPYSGQKFGTT